MKLLNPIRLSVGLAALFVAQAGWAAGTAAGTPVTNTATISYAVGGVDQADITSAPADFLVDRKVDLDVTGDSSTPIKVTPSSIGVNATPVNQLIYTLTNEGNDTQDFEISLSDLAPAGSDDFDGNNCKLYINDAQETGIAVTPLAVVDNLAPDATAKITVVCDIPALDDGVNNGVNHGDIATLDILATALHQDGTALVNHSGDADVAGALPGGDVQNVFADATGTNTDGANNNAQHSATQSYIIEVPMLSITKSSAVISDPINNTTNPKRIPGAIIEYTIDITNGTTTTGSSQASNVTVKDVIEEITKGQVSFVTGVVITGESSTDPLLPLTTTDITEPTAAANELLITGLDIAPGTTATVKFRVEIESTANTNGSTITYP